MEGYKSVIDVFVEKFQSSIPEGRPVNINLIQNFRKYLQNTVTYIEAYRAENPEIPEEYVLRILSRKARELIGSDMETKNDILIEEPKLENLRNVSNTIFEQAQKKMNGEPVSLKIEEESLDKLYIRLDAMVEPVRGRKREEAEAIRSETILDIWYLMGNEERISLRLYHAIRAKEKGLE